MSNTPTPYIVSGDIRLLLQGWALRAGFTLPSAEFFTELREEFTKYFRAMFPGFVLIDEAELQAGLSQLVAEADLLPISLDGTYYRGHHLLEMARTMSIDPLFGGLRDAGTGARAGCPSIEEQYQLLSRTISRHPEVCLVDDVIFEGNLMVDVVERLRTRGINVTTALAGVTIGEGCVRLENMGVKVLSVHSFDEVVDEVCERDFYPGVPLCGRLLMDAGNTGIPYIAPWGKPAAWASIPEHLTEDVSAFCRQQTIKLFEAIEAASGKTVRTCDLERGVYQMPMTNRRFVDNLRDAPQRFQDKYGDGVPR